MLRVTLKNSLYSGFPESNKTPPTTEVSEPYLPFTASTQAMMLGCRPRPYLAVTHPRPRSQDARVIACRLGTCGLAPARTGLFPRAPGRPESDGTAAKACETRDPRPTGLFPRAHRKTSLWRLLASD